MSLPEETRDKGNHTSDSEIQVFALLHVTLGCLCVSKASIRKKRIHNAKVLLI